MSQQDRLSTAADHNLVVQDDPAAAARLRLALAAALQSANLAAPSSKAAKAAKLGPLQGLDAAGVADYVGQTLTDLVQAAQGLQGKPEANGAAGSDEEGSEDGEDAVAGAHLGPNLGFACWCCSVSGGQVESWCACLFVSGLVRL